ncbi:MAG TPA: hypothetical protein EYH35_02005 [Thiotrichaceae bacterium]|nr:hypothetical protein [Thiotrichaceae bacterium]
MNNQPLSKAMQTYSSPEAVYYDDEIDLYDLWRTLSANKLIIMVTVAVTLVIGGLYAYFTPPVYEIKATYIPPSQSNIAVLNTVKLRLPQKMNLRKFKTTEYVYGVFKQALYARTTKYLILKSYLSKELNGLSDSEVEDFIEKYIVNNITVSESKIKKGQTSIKAINIKLKVQDKIDGVILFKKLLLAIEESVKQQLLGDLNAFVQREVVQREHLKETYLKSEHNSIKNKIILYSEAAKVAYALGIEDSSGLPSTIMLGDFLSELDTDLLYLRGYKVLNTLISSLKSRKDNAPYIPALVRINAELDLLRFPIDEKSLVVARLDQPPREPLHPVKPKKSLILVISGLLGLMLGIAFVFFRQFLVNARERYEQENKG